jgi:hypothetical protein
MSAPLENPLCEIFSKCLRFFDIFLSPAKHFLLRLSMNETGRRFLAIFLKE